MKLSWNRLVGRWKHLLGVRSGRHRRGDAPLPERERDDSLEREIERAHAMRIGEPLEQPSRQ